MVRETGHWTLTLEFHHPYRGAAEITAALRLEPDRCWDKGAARNTPEGKPLAGRHREAFWCKDLKIVIDDPLKPLASIIASQLDSLEFQKEFIRAFDAEGGKVQLTLYWNFDSSSDDDLPISLMKRLADFGMGIRVAPIRRPS